MTEGDLGSLRDTVLFPVWDYHDHNTPFQTSVTMNAVL